MRWNFQFRILDNRQPFSNAPEDSVIRKLMEVIRMGLKKAEESVNSVYEAINPKTAPEADLDTWGSILGVWRLPDEGDEDYRGRILEKLRAKREVLTISAIKGGLQEAVGINASLEHIRALGWPLSWGDAFVSYREKMKILLEVPQTMDGQDLDNIEVVLKDRLLFGVKTLIVSVVDGNYMLRRRV